MPEPSIQPKRSPLSSNSNDFASSNSHPKRSFNSCLIQSRPLRSTVYLKRACIRSFEFEDNGDRLGWIEGSGKHHYTLFIQNGRIKDTEDFKLKTAIKELAKVHKGDFRMTPNQNLIIANVDEKDKPEIQKIIDNYGLTDGKNYSGLRDNLSFEL